MDFVYAKTDIYLHTGYDHSLYGAEDDTVADVVNSSASDGYYDYSDLHYTPDGGHDVFTVDAILSWGLTEDLDAPDVPVSASDARAPAAATSIDLIYDSSSSRGVTPVALVSPSDMDEAICLQPTSDATAASHRAPQALLDATPAFTPVRGASPEPTLRSPSPQVEPLLLPDSPDQIVNGGDESFIAEASSEAAGEQQRVVPDADEKSSKNAQGEADADEAVPPIAGPGSQEPCTDSTCPPAAAFGATRLRKVVERQQRLAKFPKRKKGVCERKNAAGKGTNVSNAARKRKRDEQDDSSDDANFGPDAQGNKTLKSNATDDASTSRNREQTTPRSWRERILDFPRPAYSTTKKATPTFGDEPLDVSMRCLLCGKSYMCGTVWDGPLGADGKYLAPSSHRERTDAPHTHRKGDGQRMKPCPGMVAIGARSSRAGRTKYNHGNLERIVVAMLMRYPELLEDDLFHDQIFGWLDADVQGWWEENGEALKKRAEDVGAEQAVEELAAATA